MKILFVVGPPGVGKTTLVRELLDPDSYFIQKPKWTVGPRVVAAGHYMGQVFDGADTVPYNGARECLEYWKQSFLDHELTIFDGDRFSNRTALSFFDPWSTELVCLHLEASQELLDARRAGRGSNQNETWLKGRVTKALNFSRQFPGHVLNLEASKVPGELALRVREFLA